MKTMIYSQASTALFRSAARRGFSMIEMLIALTITATLMTASLAALDSGFKSYKLTTEGASTQVVSRIVMHRMMSMIRNGTEFGPYPIDPLDIAQNPVKSTFIEFVSVDDAATGDRIVIRLERRDAEAGSANPYELWYIEMKYSNDTLTSSTSRPLITNLRALNFTLEYDVGPRLQRATVDMTVQPDDADGARVTTDLDVPAIRLVSSVSPRKLDEY